MSGVVNLRAARKARDRAAARAQADASAAKHGRTKVQRKLEEAQAEKARAALDAVKRDEG